MRPREEIVMHQSTAIDSACYDRNTVEVLLDIRDLLIEMNKSLKVIEHSFER